MHRVLFHIGPFVVYSYGFFLAVAVLFCAWLIKKDAAQSGLKGEVVVDGLFWVFVSGLIGARLAHVVVNIGYYATYPQKIFALRDGGLAVHGALFGGLAAGAIFCAVKKIDFWKWSDLVAPYMALGQAIGRIGCFFNGCCYGKVIGGAKMPVQLFSSFILFLLYAFILGLRKKNIFPGSLIIVYFFLYSFIRFFTDFLRGDCFPVFLGLTAGQVISVVVMVVAGILFICRYKIRNSKHEIRNKS